MRAIDGKYASLLSRLLCGGLLAGIFVLGQSRSATAGNVIVYLDNGEKIFARLVTISDENIRLDLPGSVVFRTVETARVDSVVTDESARRVLYSRGTHGPNSPRSQNHPSSPPVKRQSLVTTNRSYHFQEREAYNTFSLFWSYRKPVTILRINLPDELGNAVPFSMRMEEGTGFGGRFGAFFPVTRSGISAGLNLEISSLRVKVSMNQAGEEVFSGNGSMLSLDGSFAVRIPLVGEDEALYLTPNGGIGLRKITAEADTMMIEEIQAAYFGGLQVDYLFASSVALSSEVKVWNSGLEDLLWVDIPRYTTIEFRGGLNFYFH